MIQKLPPSFYNRSTKTVAKELLGKRLVRVTDQGVRLSGLIVEVEAYLGIKDKAAHTFGRRRTPRNEVMWGEGGIAYVYFIYGIHYCLNAVTRSHGQPEAVLIRALQCEEGLEVIRARRKVKNEIHYASGPGKLCQALGIDRSLNGISLQSDNLFIENTGLKIPTSRIVATSRIGVDYAGKAKDWPLRFYIKGNKAVSKF